MSYYIETAVEQNVTCTNESAFQTCFLRGGEICFCKRRKQIKWLNEIVLNQNLIE